MQSNILGMPIELWAIVGPFLGGIIGVGISSSVLWITSSRRINADLKAKTRLEWIKEVRELISEIIALHHDLVLEKNQYEIGQTTKEEAEEELTKIAVETSKKRHLFQLYFSVITYNKNNDKYEENEENTYIRKLINDYTKELADFRKVPIRNGKTVTDDLTPKLIKFRDYSSDYLKKEWDKAKKNK